MNQIVLYPDVMLIQVLIGCIIMIATTVIHAGGMAVGFSWFIMIYAKRLNMDSLLKRSLVVGGLILILFVATLIEAGIWAATYTLLGAIPEFEKALYFSMVTYTTLGYGDIVLEDQWRLLSSFEATNGIIMFGWTTALLILAIRQVSRVLRKVES